MVEVKLSRFPRKCWKIFKLNFSFLLTQNCILISKPEMNYKDCNLFLNVSNKICSKVYASILTCPKQYAWSLPRVTRKVRLANIPKLRALQKLFFSLARVAAALEFVLSVKCSLTWIGEMVTSNNVSDEFRWTFNSNLEQKKLFHHFYWGLKARSQLNITTAECHMKIFL